MACPACENREQPIGNCRCGRFVEISNSLFIENYIDDDGKLIPAGTVFAECVVGLERTEMVLRNLPSVYHVQRFARWCELLSECLPNYSSNMPQHELNIILDHLSAFVKLTEDGAPAPGRGGRKHIMRKLAREAMVNIEGNQWDMRILLGLFVSPLIVTVLSEEYLRFTQFRSKHNPMINKPYLAVVKS